MMKRMLVVSVVCASCGGADGQAPQSAPVSADRTYANLESCYVVKDDLGAVGFFAAFEPGTSAIPERLDSITFHGPDGTTPVLTWSKGVDLKPLDEVKTRRARRRPSKLAEPRLVYATNVKAVDWGRDSSRWPMSATVTMGGAIQPSCLLRELITGSDQSRPTTLGAANGDDDDLGYGNCPHCVASFLCGCLGLQDELDYCPPPYPETLENCSDVLDYLFTPPAS